MILEIIAFTGISGLFGAGVREAALAGFKPGGSARMRIKPRSDKGGDIGIFMIGRVISQAFPGKLRERFEAVYGARAQRSLTMAGQSDIEPLDVLGLRLVLAIAGFVGAVSWSGSMRTGIALGIISGGLLQRWPEAWLKGHVSVRRKVFSKLLPEFIELIALGVKAGLSLDRSVELYCDYFQNPLAAVFSLALDEMAVGKPRGLALQAVARKNQIETLSTLIASIARAERLGSPLSDVLREQARAARESHEEVVRELSATAPIKMLGPIAGLILPALLIVIIGPALLRFI
jgi:Flp pilus assembly protein TadB